MLRGNHRFGSIVDPRDESDVIAKKVNFIEVPLTDIVTGNSLSPTDLVTRLSEANARILLYGEYGIGKSMTARFIFNALAKRYRDGVSSRVTVFLNLREHTGQRRPSEALRTHCEDIGFERPNDLVAAWKAGYVIPILDGFDEMSSPGWGRSLSKIREYRYAAMGLIREFIEQTPSNLPVALLGRSNYFDHFDEMKKSLGITSYWTCYTIDQLDETQANKLLRSLGHNAAVPDWVPPRPLMLSYYASISVGSDFRGNSRGISAAEGWDNFFDRLSAREARQREPVVTPETVRIILHNLATLARREPDGLGKFSIQEMSDVFSEIAGYFPDEDAQGLLLRLPGLRPHASGDGSRAFVDISFASALKGGDIAEYILDPFNQQRKERFRDCFSSGKLAKQMVAHLLHKKNIAVGSLKRPLELASDDGFGQLASDVLLSWVEFGEFKYDKHIFISGCEEEFLCLEEEYCDFSKITFDGCVFHNYIVDDGFDQA